MLKTILVTTAVAFYAFALYSLYLWIDTSWDTVFLYGAIMALSCGTLWLRTSAKMPLNRFDAVLLLTFISSSTLLASNLSKPYFGNESYDAVVLDLFGIACGIVAVGIILQPLFGKLQAKRVKVRSH